jgi:outer membrane lipoprotein SlyB
MANDIHELSLAELDIVGGGALGGISALIAVTQMKTDSANDAAMAGALAGALGGAAAKGPHKIG